MGYLSGLEDLLTPLITIGVIVLIITVIIFVLLLIAFIKWAFLVPNYIEKMSVELGKMNNLTKIGLEDQHHILYELGRLSKMKDAEVNNQDRILNELRIMNGRNDQDRN